MNLSTFALVRLLPDETHIGFIRMRTGAFVLSLALVLGSVAAFFTLGLNLGIDFRGGTAIEISTEGPADIALIREVVTEAVPGDVQVQGFGTESDVLIRVGEIDPEVINALEGFEALDAAQAQQAVQRLVTSALTEAIPDVSFERMEVISPQVSDELRVAGTTAVLVSLFLMLVYIWLRFEWQYSVGAVLALAHDVIVTIGFFAVTQLQFNLPTIAAILTIVGYSMNDTVVVYDRIREMFRKYKSQPTAQVLDMAINETLSRTILTSGTTLVALIAMAIMGGAALESFALALIWGVVIGTYSSIFVAAPLLTVTGVRRDTGDQES
ncbi:MAG: protein translocase subunit SecF [Caulobacterales bacterium]|uniref:protein translocase subunit SecF n=1 Tax=Glycocaulis sp. TaxID=1969725 RepID=UPI003F9FAB4C